MLYSQGTSPCSRGTYIVFRQGSSGILRKHTYLTGNLVLFYGGEVRKYALLSIITLYIVHRGAKEPKAEQRGGSAGKPVTL